MTTVRRKFGRKTDKVLMGRYALNPKVTFQSDDAKVIDDLANDLTSLPKVYDDNREQVTQSSSTKTPKVMNRLDADIELINASDDQFRNSGMLLMSDPRLTNLPNKKTYSSIAREVGRLLYYPGVDRAAVSRLGALMVMKAKLSDAGIASTLRNEPLKYNSRDVNQRINNEIDRIIDQVNLLSRPEIIRRFEQLNTSIGIRATTIREQAKAFEAAKTQRERFSAIRDIANEGLPKISSDNE
jgi:hypothetical protein